MTSSHTLRLFCHAVALLIETIGTVFILLDTVRMDAYIHRFQEYPGGILVQYEGWYYHSARLGFSMLFVGILFAAFVLWLEHLSHVQSLCKSSARETPEEAKEA
jgi:hypothetical protein